MPLARTAQGRDRLTGPALLLSLPLLVAGLALPSLHFTNLWVIEAEYSLWRAIWAFYEKRHFSLFALLLAFTVVAPLAKSLFGLWLFYLADAATARSHRLVHTLSALSKWSMLDVFIVAILVLALEGSLLTATDLGLGLAMFAAAVVLSGWAYGRLARLALHPPPPAEPSEPPHA